MISCSTQQAVPDLLRVVDRLYESCSGAVAAEPPLDVLRSGFGATAAAVGWYDVDARRGALTEVAGVNPDFVHAYDDHYCTGDAVFADRRRVTQAGEVWRDRDVLAAEELQESSFYREWALPQGLQHFARGVLAQEGRQLTYVAFARRTEEHDFAPDDLEVLRQMLPHIRRSLKLGRDIRALHATAGAFAAVLDRLPVAVLVVDAGAKVVTKNRAAGRLLANNEELRLDGDMIQLRRNEARGRLRQLLAAAHSASPMSAFSDSMHIERPDRRPFYVTVASLGAGAAERQRSFALAMIVDPEQEPVIDTETLRLRLGLTRAEAQLTALLAHGVRLEAAADALAISYGTARTHLKHIFYKTGVERQVELVRLILGNPSFLRSEP